MKLSAKTNSNTDKATKKSPKKPLDPRTARGVRFWEKVTPTKDDSCWLWTAHTRGGYGRFRDVNPVTGKKSTRSAHRVAFELSNNISLTDGQVILHSRECTDRRCCRPSHLRIGTLSENYHDAIASGRRPGKTKITPEQAIDVVAHWRSGEMTQRAIADKFGLTTQHVEHILSGRSGSKHTGIKPKSPKTAKKQGPSVRGSRKAKAV